MKMKRVDKSICLKKEKLNLKHTQIHHAIVAVTPFFTSEHWYSWVQLHLAINCIYTHYAANDTAKKTTDTATAPSFSLSCGSISHLQEKLAIESMIVSPQN
jgi:hypothetical protein